MSPDELEMMPESVHLMNKVLNIADKTQHVCACCFDVKGVELCTEEEKEKAQCDNCKANLFVNIDGTCTPCLYFFNFGVANQITALFQSSDNEKATVNFQMQYWHNTIDVYVSTAYATWIMSQHRNNLP